MSPQEKKVALPFRSETILGVCEALGEDFGFNPLFLRVPLAASVIYSPKMAIAAYFALGAVVLISRLLFPKKAVVEDVEVAQQPALQPPHAGNDRQELSKAA